MENGKENSTTIKQLKELVEQFRDARDWKQFHTPKDNAIDVAAEAGELVQHFRYKTNEQIQEFLKDPQKMQEISYEMADVLWGLLYLAIDLKIDLAEALEKKLQVTAKRYPIEKSFGINKKYNE